MSSYIFDSEALIWHREETQHFKYSDGDESEQYLLNVLKDAKDKSIYSEELMKRIKDWPSRYHFSPTRHNLLRPLNINSNMNVLEIGCGCGAMTRYLGEVAGHVVAVEGSYRRASIAATRCSDLNNVEVYCDNFIHFETIEKFDIVTLIGVLEYSPSFIEGPDPIQGLLLKAKQYLKPDGLLILAIENRLGLKYFNGAAEDHTGRLFDGINDFYSNEGVITFGKKELSDKLEQVGLSDVEYLYPFPDYKLPNVIVGEKAFDLPTFYIDQIIGQYKAEDYSGQANRLFHEERAWNVLLRNGIAKDLANSFLVIARANVAMNNLYPESWLASTYSTLRKKVYAVETAFMINDKNSIVVEKRKMFEQKANSASIIHRLEKVDYIQGEVFNYKLAEILQVKVDKTTFHSYISPWIEYLISNSLNGVLPGRFLDCMPSNIIRIENEELVYIDDEWEFKGELSLNYVVFRGLVNTITQLDPYERSKVLKDRSVSEFIIDITSMSEILLTVDDIKELLEQEALLHENIYPNDKESYLEYSNAWINRTFIESYAPFELVDSRIQWQIERYKNKPQLKIYWASVAADFNEGNSHPYSLKWNELGIYRSELFTLKDVGVVRIDPQIRDGWGSLVELSIYDEHDRLIWSPVCSNNEILKIEANGIVSKQINDELFFITGNDSAHWILPIGNLQVEARYAYIVIRLIANRSVDNEIYRWMEEEIQLKKIANQENTFLLAKNESLENQLQKVLQDNTLLLDRNDSQGRQILDTNEQLLAIQRYSQQMQQELEAMTNSRSWKITKVIRFTGRVLRKVKKKLKKRVKLVLQSYRILKEKRMKWDELLSEIKKISYTVVISHTDYLKSMGGTEKSILEQTKARTKIGKGTIVLFPAHHYSFEDTESTVRYGIYIDEKLQGYFSLNDCMGFISEISIYIKEMHIHHLLFWQYVDYMQIHEYFVGQNKPIRYFAHDFFISCSSYHMIQENEKGSQPCIDKMKSETLESVCADCIHGLTVHRWRSLLITILEDTADIIVPSIFVQETIKLIYPDLTKKIKVKPHLSLIETGSRLRSPDGRKIRIAYLGYKMDNKGWKLWDKIYNNSMITNQYDLYHIGSTEQYNDRIKSYSYSFVEDGPMAAVNLLEQHEIDVVLLLSIVPESYSFTLQEALAAGTYIMTTNRSGNIAHTIQKLGVQAGVVLTTESAVIHLLLDENRLRNLVQTTRPKYKLVSTYEEEGMI